MTWICFLLLFRIELVPVDIPPPFHESLQTVPLTLFVCVFSNYECVAWWLCPFKYSVIPSYHDFQSKGDQHAAKILGSVLHRSFFASFWPILLLTYPPCIQQTPASFASKLGMAFLSVPPLLKSTRYHLTINTSVFFAVFVSTYLTIVQGNRK